MKREILSLSLLCVIFFSLTLVQAIEIEPGKQGEDKLLYQTCNNCTFCNITSVTNEDGTTLLPNTAFDQNGTYYSKVLKGGNLTTLGTYTYCYYCGNLVDSETGCIDFEVTPSGRQGSENIALVIILILIIYASTFICFFGRNIPLSALTGMLMTFFGVWIIRNGIVIYRDNLTNYFGYVTIAIGAIVCLWSLIEWIQETF